MRNAELHPTAVEVARALPDGWTAEPASDSLAGVHLAGPDGARVFLRHEFGGKQRLSIVGALPPSDAYLTHGDSRGEITVARDRPPAAIAREILRRVLPRYLPTLAKVLDNNARNVTSKQRREYNAGELAKLIGGASVRTGDGQRDHSTVVHWYSTTSGLGYGDVELSYDGQGVSEVKVRSLSVEAAERMLRALADGAHLEQ